MSKWIKKGDQVVVLKGNDKGRTGTVLRRKKDRVVIQGINIRKKHAKRKTQVQTATILEIEVPVHVSNVSLCDSEGKRIAVKVKHKEQAKELVYMQSGKETTFRVLKK